MMNGQMWESLTPATVNDKLCAINSLLRCWLEYPQCIEYLQLPIMGGQNRRDDDRK